MLTPVRAAILLLVAACSFTIESGTAPDDGPPDVIDTPTTAWAVDPASGKACPTNATEWTAFLAAKGLSIAPPAGLWLMQESSGNLADSIGSVSLAPFGSPTPSYRRAVTGWTRSAVATTDGIAAGFLNASAPSLPDTSVTSMTVLVFYATESAPAGARSLMFGGSGSVLAYANVGIDTTRHLSLTVTPNAATGTVDYGATVFPLIMKIDTTHLEQKIVTKQETIAPTYAQRSARGIYIGGASAPAPDARFLYMAAWYGTSAEFDDATAKALIAALGF